MATPWELKDSPAFEVIPEGEILPAQVSKVEEQLKPWKDDNGNDVYRVNFTFSVSEGDFVGRNVYGETPTTFTNNPDCKLRAWVLEILGQDDLPVGFKVDPEQLVGLPVRVVIGQRERKAADGSPSIRNFVQDVIRQSAFSAAGDIF